MIKPKKLNLKVYTRLKKYKEVYYLGNLKLLNASSVTVVGSRKSTSYGLRVCSDLCSFLGEKGYVTVSGYVAGIDMCVFDTAQKLNYPTIVCLGYGFDFMPKKLYEYLESSKNILVLSQFKNDQSAKKWTFPSRDALLATVGLTTVVVEAGLPSGTFYTVKQAFKEGKKVFSIPGNIYSSQSLGANYLIGEGIQNKKASILYNFNTLLNYLNPSSQISSAKKIKKTLDIPLSKKEQKILNLLNANFEHFDDILKKTNLSSQELLVTLSKLELLGLIKQEGNSMYCRC